jgi:hypothetical protein
MDGLGGLGNGSGNGFNGFQEMDFNGFGIGSIFQGIGFQWIFGSVFSWDIAE